MPQGYTNNPHGRKKGKPNKVTKELRETLHDAFKEEIENIPATLASLETAKDKLDMLVKFLPYLLPKLQTVTITDTEAEEEERIMQWQIMQPPNVTFISKDFSKPIN